jgi:hypothetical protein
LHSAGKYQGTDTPDFFILFPRREIGLRQRNWTMKKFFYVAASTAMMAALFSGCALFTGGSAGKPFDFALVGDVPYTPEQTTNLFPNMMRELNAANIEFVVHDGDIKAGATPCTDQVFAERLRDFQSSEHPFIYLFGDNEWTDCAHATNGFDPVERLGRLREIFTAGDQSLGRRKLPLARQSDNPRFTKFRENVRWEMGGVTFVGLNVPGNINNYGRPEFAERNAANLAWLKESFAFAKLENRAAIMIIMQANPFPERGSTNRIHAGFRPMLELLEQETLAFQKPVVLVHGDSHYFRIDKPLYGTKSHRRIENFTRVETFGNPDVHWLRVTADARDPEVFTFRQQLVRSNFVNHGTAKAVNTEHD